MTTYKTFRVAGGPNFSKHVAQAKRLHGTYNGETKTWEISDDMVSVYGVDGLRVRGLLLVEDSQSRSHKHDHNCPANFGGVCECQE